MTIKPTLSEIRFFLIVLTPLARSVSGTLPVAEVIRSAQRADWLTPYEKSRVPSRSDSRFANKVHNEVSHRDSRKNLIKNRLIDWREDTSSFILLEKGRKFLLAVCQRITEREGLNLVAIDKWLKAYASQIRNRPAS